MIFGQLCKMPVCKLLKETWPFLFTKVTKTNQPEASKFRTSLKNFITRRYINGWREFPSMRKFELFDTGSAFSGEGREGHAAFALSRNPLLSTNHHGRRLVVVPNPSSLKLKPIDPLRRKPPPPSFPSSLCFLFCGFALRKDAKCRSFPFDWL